MSLFRTGQALDYPVQEFYVGIGTAPDALTANYSFLMYSNASTLSSDDTNGLYLAMKSYFEGVDFGDGISVQLFHVYEFDEEQNDITPS